MPHGHAAYRRRSHEQAEFWHPTPVFGCTLDMIMLVATARGWRRRGPRAASGSPAPASRHTAPCRPPAGAETVGAARSERRDKGPFGGLARRQPALGGVTAPAELHRLGPVEVSCDVGVHRPSGRIGHCARDEPSSEHLVKVGPGGDLMSQVELPGTTEAQVAQIASGSWVAWRSSSLK